MSPFEVVQAIQPAGVDAVGLDSRRTVVVLRSVDDQDVGETVVIRFRCVSQRIEKFGGSHEGKEKRHPVISATVARVRIHDERAGPPSSPIQTYRQSWISTAADFPSSSPPPPPASPPPAVEESCLKDYPATVCCADELPTHVGVRSTSRQGRQAKRSGCSSCSSSPSCSSTSSSASSTSISSFSSSCTSPSSSCAFSSSPPPLLPPPPR